ncbi:putative transcriptional regulator [Clavispora lusitaniae]|uniref:HTH APSES-type domain-containing protein n=2 Tax=Clavispora lusitaniae TaxID=36911 RepID=C4Y091_CLAL4|nr:uncharacterized protein CLUG_01623 [Clavispora lusitaniae ATCC 42720]KAF5212135.1 hypothetical protein E0198_001691 [Clavispora lusitaniae]EEQ37500.1 hypothetical protein CLUG_01623 [Clavispora lusitaniae ATCC 42720]QFZ26502.1 putative transcriptional regulator [Clavispora lusitaniae]QFZ32170.1 putative transcriptional regulator [Clavispora lusitaniae]QFZ37839.1 putative transcriptional regulator [Clavispora lusitaniae]
MTSSYDNIPNYTSTAFASKHLVLNHLGDVAHGEYSRFMEKSSNSVPMAQNISDELLEPKSNESSRDSVHYSSSQWNSHGINMYLGPSQVGGSSEMATHMHHVGSPNVIHRSQNSLGSVSSLSPTLSMPKSNQRKISKPRITTIYWEAESTTCFQVKAGKVVVSRREKDDYVNGTKLLNVTGMSRGKRDGLLKTEKGRIVVRNGPMNLKGVWIPFHRASEIARNEGVDQLLYPLFVSNIREFYQVRGQDLRQESASDNEEVSTAPESFMDADLSANDTKTHTGAMPFYFP